MSIKRKRDKNPESTFKMLYDPYSNGKSSIDEIIQAYLNDKNAIVTIDDKMYYRAIQIEYIRIGKVKLVALLDCRMKLKTNDILLDDNDNQFIITGFAMFRFASGISDWFSKASFVILSGTNYDNIGHYFTKL